MKTRTIQPSRIPSYPSPSLISPAPATKIYPKLTLDHESFPEAKGMAVGEKKQVMMTLHKTAHKESKEGDPYDNKSEFEIHKIGMKSK